ncbi:MAG: hypothetical protein LUC33_03135 [Prevotellaceae bacterium]|nr:hypothetical protein [Prevotellaceae bacterium]
MADSDNNKAQTRREAVMARVRERYPDREIDDGDEDSVFGAVDDYARERDGELDGYRERERGLGELFASDPRSAAFLNSWREGADPAVEMVRRFGDDFREALDDPERQEALAEANKEWLDRVARNKELEAEYQSNIGSSLENIELVKKETGAGDEDMDAAMSMLIKSMSDSVVGRFEKDTILMALKAVTHARDMAQARREGEVAGRNERIEERLRRPHGDGVPSLGGSPGGQAPRRARSIFDIAREA